MRFNFKKIKNFRNIAISFSVILVVLVICELATVFSFIKKNKQLLSIQQISVMEPLNQDNKLFVSMTRTNTFSDTNSNVTIYECYIANTTPDDFANWKIKLKFPQSVELENFWNANCYFDGDYFIIAPESKATTVLEAGKRHSFGFIINSKDDFVLRTLNISGNVSKRLLENPLVVILLFFIIVVILVQFSLIIMYRIMNAQIQVLKNQKERVDAIIEQTILTFIQFIDAKDEYTRGHSARVGKYSMLLAKELGFDEDFQKDMYYMGLMHDIGKLTIPDEILNKTSKLSKEEWEIIRLHTTNGADLLKNFTILPDLRKAVLYHHERYDGYGYMYHLKRDEIPLCARIICVADSYDAMNTDRCYRISFSDERIIKELKRCAGSQFDPDVVTAMISLISKGELNSYKTVL